MAGEWPSRRVGEIAASARNALVGGPFGSNLVSRDYVENGVPVIRGQNMAGRWVAGEFVYVTEEKADSLESNLARPSDIVFTQRGTLGQVALVPPAPFETYLVSQSQMKLTVNREIADPLFFYYQFISPEQQEHIRQHAIQVGVPHTNLGILRDTPVVVPPLSEQRAIAHILGTLDDKIELNRRINETLESIARAIFKSWFVDFDPVRAKASGEPPESICRRLGLTPDLLALFPDRLVDSELGEIPEGWRSEFLEQLTCYLNRGLSPKYVEEGGVLVLNQKCVRGGHVDKSKGRRHDPTQRKVEGRLLEVGDILVNSTGVGTLGRVAQVLAIDEPTIVDSHITVVRSASEKVSWNYLGITMLERQSEIEALGEGSTGQTELSRVRLGALRVLLPPKPLRDHFDACVTGLRQRGMTNNAQSVTLAQIRDALLPKLLSGELKSYRQVDRTEAV